jgi:alpha-ketoglutarate-dependent taurine dioxygenase
LGDHLGWYPNHSSDYLGRKYTENHSENRKVSSSSGEDIILEWHIEHVDYDQQCPLVAGVWNMWHFNCEPNTGLTYFVDTTKVYEKLEDEEKKFLSSAKISWIDAYGFGPHYGMAVQPHWITGDPTIRVEITRQIKSELVEIDGQTPTSDDAVRFEKIQEKFMKIISNDLNLRFTHQWEEGDILIPDLYRMAHAVTGGFDPKDRSFTGHWVFSKDPSALEKDQLPYAWR